RLVGLACLFGLSSWPPAVGADSPSVLAKEGYPVVAPFKPTWCSQASTTGAAKSKATSRVGRTLTAAARSGLTPERTASLLNDLCEHPEDPEFQALAASAVQLWVNRTGQTKDAAVDSMVARIDPGSWDTSVQQGCRDLVVDEEPTFAEAQTARARSVLFGCRNPPFYVSQGKVSPEYEWFVDRTDAPPTELDRLTIALQCLPRGTHEWRKDDWTAVGLCGADVRALDAAKLERETADMNAAFRAIAAESYAKAKALLAELERSASTKTASDRDYKALLETVPKNAWAEWVTAYKKHKRAMDATFAFEEALLGPRKSAVEGCWGRIEPGMVKFVKSSRFKSKDAFMKGVEGPIGYVLLNALGACYAVTSPSSVGALYLQLNERTRPWRGPRAAVRFAMIDELNRIKSDRDQFPIDFAAFQANSKNFVRIRATSPERTKIPSTGGWFNARTSGIVKTVGKAQNELVPATFKSTSWTEDKYHCVATDKISHVQDGRLYYRRTCKKVGRVKRTKTPAPTTFYDWSARGIRPNAFVIMAVEAGSEYEKQRRGFPIEVYQNKEQSRLLNMYGFAL
ncbi:MAG: hypothetical protein AAF997_21295, partial [Myxococcota bacterium]